MYFRRLIFHINFIKIVYRLEIFTISMLNIYSNRLFNDNRYQSILSLLWRNIILFEIYCFSYFNKNILKYIPIKINKSEYKIRYVKNIGKRAITTFSFQTDKILKNSKKIKKKKVN